MNGFLDLAVRRRSVRRYDGRRAVPREALDRCAEAARVAPSACHSQPWRFIIADRDPVRKELARAAFGGLYRMNAFAAEAPVLVAVVRERSRYAARLGGAFRGVEYGLLDIGAACEHFLLQAVEEGLGTCWLGWFDERGVRRVLGLARAAKVDVLLSLGYPAGDDDPRPRQRLALDDVRRYAS